MKIAPLIDHTLLKPDATTKQVEQLCREACEFGFWSVCVNPCRLPLVRDILQGSAVKTCCVAGFPLGANLAATKAAEARQVIEAGADEIDMVLNIGALKSGEVAAVRADLTAVAEVCRAAGVLSKVILETHLLTEPEKQQACELAVEARLDFVKTSTGFSGGGATEADIALMSRLVKSHGLGVKASGGIRSLADLQRLVAAGATRIGTSSGVKLMHEAAGHSVSDTSAGY